MSTTVRAWITLVLWVCVVWALFLLEIEPTTIEDAMSQVNGAAGPGLVADYRDHFITFALTPGHNCE